MKKTIWLICIVLICSCSKEKSEEPAPAESAAASACNLHDIFELSVKELDFKNDLTELKFDIELI
jgi:hypothetical protein